MARPSMDPDSPHYSNDDPTWGEERTMDPDARAASRVYAYEPPEEYRDAYMVGRASEIIKGLLNPSSDLSRITWREQAREWLADNEHYKAHAQEVLKRWLRDGAAS